MCQRNCFKHTLLSFAALIRRSFQGGCHALALSCTELVWQQELAVVEFVQQQHLYALGSLALQ